jgi:S-formylglutathione hydrolase FrmB
MKLAALALAAVIPHFHDGHGIHVLTSKQLDGRLGALAVSTSALPGPANIRILLPAGYAAHPRRRYPVLYLLHGTSGGAADWTVRGGAEQTTAGRQLIVVMPDIALHDGGGGWCTDWYNGGAGGPPEWETFHIAQLIPWVDANLRTVASRAGRAIAGLSQGGFCAMSYAARHPDLFTTAVSFSGAPDIAYDLEAQALVTPIINATEVFLDGAAPNSMFGDRITEELNWAAHDPATLAGNLRGMKLLLYSGNGVPGPLDSRVDGGAVLVEAGVATLTQLFHNDLQALGIPSTYDAYGPGTHSWPYWTRDLTEAIGPIMDGFSAPAPVAPVTYTTASPSYSVFGWRVAIDRRMPELSTLSAASTAGFTLAGSGTATVTTPAVYRRGRRYTVTIGTQSATMRAGRDRRLTISVPLGPSNTAQQYTLLADTRVYSTEVGIR